MNKSKLLQQVKDSDTNKKDNTQFFTHKDDYVFFHDNKTNQKNHAKFFTHKDDYVFFHDIVNN